MNRTRLLRTLSLGLASLTLAGFAAASQHDVAALVEADGLVTEELRDAAVATLVEADGLVTAQLRQEAEALTVARIAAADGLVVAGG